MLLPVVEGEHLTHRHCLLERDEVLLVHEEDAVIHILLTCERYQFVCPVCVFVSPFALPLAPAPGITQFD